MLTSKGGKILNDQFGFSIGATTLLPKPKYFLWVDDISAFFRTFNLIQRSKRAISKKVNKGQEKDVILF
jgi:hypothetical protein